MGSANKFSQEFKEAIVKKLLLKGGQSVAEFCNENNLAKSTVSRWRSECANVSEMRNKKNKSKYSAENILKIISETYQNTSKVRVFKLSLYQHNRLVLAYPR